MHNIKMVVNKKVKNAAGEAEYQEVGAVEVPCFDLADFGLGVESTGKDEEGVPSYGNDKLDFVMGAVWAAIKADARNKLVSGTASVKAGQKIASTVEELIAKAERSGAALQLVRDFIAAFTKYLAERSGKSAAVQALYIGMVRNRQSIAVSSEARRNGLLAQLTAFAEGLAAEEAEKFQGIVLTLADLCQSAAELDDSEL